MMLPSPLLPYPVLSVASHGVGDGGNDPRSCHSAARQPFPRLEPCGGRVDACTDDGLAVAAHGNRFLAADVDHARGGHPVEAAAGTETADDDGPAATHRAWHGPRRASK